MPGQRKYGRPHRRVRAKYERLVLAGRAHCARCGRPIDPSEPWDLDHDDEDPRVYLGPSHRACNRAEPFRRLWAQANGATNGTGNKRRDLFDGLPDPDPANTATHWSCHWYGGFNPRCPDCRRLRKPCLVAERAASKAESDWWEAISR
jgi:hypothetical protein